MSLSKVFSFLLVGIVMSSASGQQFGFSLPQDSTYSRVRLGVSNGLITIPMGLNGKIQLRMIVDTSIEHTILTNAKLAEDYGVELLRKISLGSTDDGELVGYSANGAFLELMDGTQTGDNHSLMVLEHDFLGLSTTAQTVVHGIIGRDLFGRFVVGIDNDQQVMTLWEPDSFQPPAGYDAVPLKFENGEAKIFIKSAFQNWEEQEDYFILKTGAPHTILYDSKENVYNVPYKSVETTLGNGSNGEIKGKVGRTRTVRIGNYEFEEPIASFTSTQVEGKNRGSVGMGLLGRFNFIVDYHGATLFLKPNRLFGKSFEFDLSGIKISPDGDKFFISYVQKDSPAAKVGIQVGDQVLAINGTVLTAENFTEESSVLASKPDKKITLKVLQRGKESEVSFKLVRFI